MHTAPDLQHPHDSFFKQTFGQPEVARDFLRNYLPAPVVAHLQLDTLEDQRDSFVDPDLQEHFSDLLYRVLLVSGETAYVYVLFEHKSYPDRLAAFQLLRYMVRIWERTLRQLPDEPLPPIIPVVLYHGRTPWQVDARSDALYVGPEELRRYWPAFQFQLTDLSRFTDEELQGEVFLLATLLLMKHIYDPQLRVHLPRVLHLVYDLIRQQSGLQYLYTFLRYIMSAGERVESDELRQMVEAVFSHGGDVVMGTIAQELRSEGIELGIQQGVEQGRQEGAQALRNGILAVLRMRFALSDQDAETAARKLAQVVDLQRLEALHLRALQDPTSEEYLRRLEQD